MKCDTMECFSEAITVASSPETKDRFYCIECAIAVTKQWGPGCLTTLPGLPLPWDAPAIGSCERCGTKYGKFLIGLTGDCTKCRKPLPRSKLKW